MVKPPATPAKAAAAPICEDDDDLVCGTSDSGDVSVDEALAANPDIVEKIKGGKVKAAGKIVGDVMKATRGQADAARVNELVLAAVEAL